MVEGIINGLNKGIYNPFDFYSSNTICSPNILEMKPSLKNIIWDSYTSSSKVCNDIIISIVIYNYLLNMILILRQIWRRGHRRGQTWGHYDITSSLLNLVRLVLLYRAR
jgi:hypothetical protein